MSGFLKSFLVIGGIFYLILFGKATYSHEQTHEEVLNPVQQLEGLDSPVVLSVIKDNKGFMWFMTLYGLVRYDGYQYKSYTYQPDDTSSIPNFSGISTLFADAKGRIWIGTTRNMLVKFDPVSEIFKTYTIDSIVSPNYRNWISTLYEDHSGNLWIGLQFEGLYKFNPDEETFTLYRQQTEKPIHNKDFVLSFLEMEDRNMLVGTGEGLYILDVIGDSLRPFDLVRPTPENFETATFMNLLKDVNGNIWMASDIGLIEYKPKAKELSHYFHESDNPQSLSGNLIRYCFNNPIEEGKSLWMVIGPVHGTTVINKIEINSGVVERYFNKHDKPENIYDYFIDESGLLWMASDNQGVFFIDLKKNPFEHEEIENPANNRFYSGSAFYVDHKNMLWVGTGRGGIFIYNDQGKLINHFNKLPGTKYDNPTLTYSIFEDSEHDVWISFWSDGLYRYSRTDNLMTKFELKSPIANISNDRASQLIEDDHKRLWLGSGRGLYYFDIDKKSTHHFIRLNHPLLGMAHIRSLCIDKSGSLWVTTDQDGIFCLKLDNRDSLRFTQYRHDPNSTGSISSNAVLSVDCADDGTLWIGTNNGLNRFIPETESFEWFNKDKGFDAHFVFWVRADEVGRLWLTTEKGLVRFNPNASIGKRFKRFTKRDGLPFTKVYPYHFDRDAEGNLYFGGERGFGLGYFKFHPDSISDNKNIPHVVITGFKVSNKVFSLDSAISFKKNINLKHNQNFVSFEFATLDYNDPDKNQHVYMLEGVDEQWIYSNNRRFANYSGLSQGTYTFKVKGANNDGYWNKEGASVVITIAPPPWQTWWAFIIYVLVGFGMSVLVIRFYLRRQKLLHQLELEHLEADKLKEIDGMKSKFFANISHEFRTPLTLIIGPLNKLLGKTHSKPIKSELAVVKRNAIKLLQLINQLLDLSKMESGKLQLKCSKINIVEWVKMYIQAFESLARQKKIDLVFSSSSHEINCYFDPEKMAEIINNLLSNAFKFTEKGFVKVVIDPQSHIPKRVPNGNSNVQIVVSDSGKGIPQQKLKFIFNRFYQIDDSISKKYEGTGIGLALVKELVELHQGSISAESELDKGSSFIITLPLGKEHLKSEEIETTPEFLKTIDIVPIVPVEQLAHPAIEDIGTGKVGDPILLIVEDNSDMRNYIRGYFETDYKILTAPHGKRGYEISVEFIPDIIISDVMMPVMNGYELCQAIKSDTRTSHIPLILLTARSSGSDKIEGLETGADDFVIKPFDGNELQVRVKNLVKQRELLREHFKNEFNHINPVSSTRLTSMDQQFIQKAFSIIRNRIEDPDLNVEAFAHEMAMSRVQLHRKMKAIANMSTGDFIRSVRLKKAAQMLNAQTGNVTEIAFAVGFNNPSWFATCYKKQFGVLPSEYFKN